MRTSSPTRKKDRTDCNGYRRISLVAHSGKMLLKVVASRHSNYCETEVILSGEECGFRPARSTIDALFVGAPVCKSSDHRESPCTCASSMCRKRTTLSTESCCGRYLTRSGLPTEMLSIIRNFHEGMRARERTDDGEHSERFDVTQGLRQGCMRSPFLFHVFSAAALHVVLVRFSKNDVLFRD